jgi:hypothetical protein
MASILGGASRGADGEGCTVCLVHGGSGKVFGGGASFASIVGDGMRDFVVMCSPTRLRLSDFIFFASPPLANESPAAPINREELEGLK